MRTWFCALAAACLMQTASAAVVVEQVWARATPPGSTVGVVYGHVRSEQADELISLSSPVAERAEVHASITENGMMKMRMLNALALPAKTTVQLRPAGTHIMLTGLRAPLVAGTSFDLTLRFRSAPPLTLKVSVVGPGEPEPGR